MKKTNFAKGTAGLGEENEHATERRIGRRKRVSVRFIFYSSKEPLKADAVPDAQRVGKVSSSQPVISK